MDKAKESWIRKRLASAQYTDDEGTVLWDKMVIEVILGLACKLEDLDFGDIIVRWELITVGDGLSVDGMLFVTKVLDSPEAELMGEELARLAAEGRAPKEFLPDEDEDEEEEEEEELDAAEKKIHLRRLELENEMLEAEIALSVQRANLELDKLRVEIRIMEKELGKPSKCGFSA